MPLEPNYTASHALIIGIDNYAVAPPLIHAASDATSLAELLNTTLAFPPGNITTLTNQRATKAAILQAFLTYANAAEENDRILVFFAGHGHTARSRRGEVGFLVPHDGTLDDLSSLVRWDELTRGADLIPAKHMLFIMDACYGGLAVTRALRPGAMRFLNDMLIRYARQVITAGKADEVVSDVGGPLPGHSIFSGHLLQALDGAAADPEGLLTANGVMAYVYRHVGHDADSHQTPHFGYLDGDGDMIFRFPEAGQPASDEHAPADVLVPAPAIPLDLGANDQMTLPEKTKQYLSEPRFRIQLHDFIADRTRAAASLAAEDRFAVNSPWSPEELRLRLRAYEEGMSDLVEIHGLLGFWSTQDHAELVSMPSRRLARPLAPESGLSAWISLRWYPLMLLLYSLGISSVAAGNYTALSAYMCAPIPHAMRNEPGSSLLVVLTDGIGHARDAFKQLPGHERQFVPLSEYLFKHLQPLVDDLLFLGADYEPAFDRFEILAALQYAHLESKSHPNHFWGPVGRFGWKHKRIEPSPYNSLLAEANGQRQQWPPIRSGLFDSSFGRFEEISSKYAELLGRLNFW